MDLLLASVLLVLAMPLMAVISLAIKLSSPGDVIFRQPRVGRHGNEFIIFKFRTMRAGAHLHQERLAQDNGDRVFLKIPNDDRITRVGAFLRLSSLDELPQFFNVLRGDMSLVGPRPLLPSDINGLPEGVWARRFEVLPGITGLWQVSGRSLCSDSERMQLDLDYVEQWSPWLDLRILFRTPMAVFLAKGAV